MTTTQDDPVRSRVDRLRSTTPDAEAAFTEPWELRALALAVAAHEAGHFSWIEFQDALVAAIRTWETTPAPTPWRYYERWLEALEALLAATGTFTDADLDARTRVLRATPPANDHAHPAGREPIAVDAGS